jgi:two-component system sensor histidine kinase KdpD
MQATNGAYRRDAVGTIVALVGLAALLFLMLPIRSHLTIAVPALVFVVPVILGVVVGGFVPGAVGAVAGFLLYDIFFLPPYGTLTIRAAQDWIALVVYVAVVLIVARVVTNLQAARQEADRREEDANRLFELSQALIGDFTLPQLLEQIVATVQGLFAPRWTVLLLPGASAAIGV